MRTFRAFQKIRNSVSIPTLPEVVRKVTQLIENPESGIGEIGRVVSEDAPLAARVLKIANSAYYGLQERCGSTEQACSVLGLRVLRNVVTQAAVINRFEHLGALDGFSLEELWQHSILSAQLCQRIGEVSGAELELAPDELYACGLLHDIGKVVMLDTLGDQYVDILRRARKVVHPLHVCETTLLDFNHTDVGSVLCNRWELPSGVAAAVQYHHDSEDFLFDSQPVVSLVAKADVLAHLAADEELEEAAVVFDERTRRSLALSEADARAVVDFAAEALSAIEV